MQKRHKMYYLLPVEIKANVNVKLLILMMIFV